MRLAAVLFLLPLPALADLSAPIQAALNTCLAKGPSLADRAAALTAAGWQPLPLADRSAAAQAFAPLELFRIGRLSEEDTLDRRAELLVQAATGTRWQIDQEHGSEIWLSTPAGEGFLTVRSRIADIVDCQIAADLLPDQIAAALSAPIERQDHPPVTLTYFITGKTRLDSPVLMTFAPNAFGGLPILPILTTPSVAAN